MFGGKREKTLEAELAEAKKTNERKRELLSDIAGQRDNVTEQFARMTAARAQIEKDIDGLKEQMQQVHELAENSSWTAGEICSAVIGLNNDIGAFEANHSVFVDQVRNQNEKVVEIVEKNKHFTTPMKCITETPAALRESQTALKERAHRMENLSKDMSVLALNAAIEAGRMGESGSRFVAAAEEVRAYSDIYEREARELKEQLKSADERIAELEEQAHHLSELLKENNISMGKLYKDSSQNMAAYEEQQIVLKELIPEAMVGRADALRQAEEENAGTQERMLGQVEEIAEELGELKGGADELEEICKRMQQSADAGKQE